jgi:hypothetical protein
MKTLAICFLVLYATMTAPYQMVLHRPVETAPFSGHFVMQGRLLSDVVTSGLATNRESSNGMRN